MCTGVRDFQINVAWQKVETMFVTGFARPQSLQVVEQHRNGKNVSTLNPHQLNVTCSSWVPYIKCQLVVFRDGLLKGKAMPAISIDITTVTTILYAPWAPSLTRYCSNTASHCLLSPQQVFLSLPLSPLSSLCAWTWSVPLLFTFSDCSLYSCCCCK